MCSLDFSAISALIFSTKVSSGRTVVSFSPCRRKETVLSSFSLNPTTRYVVKLLPYALFILNKYRGLTGDGRVFAMSTLDSIDDSLKNIARECGIDKQLSFHLARHTYATTICLSNGVSLETLSKMLGHKQITTTQIYAKVTQPMIDREVTMLREKLATKFSV